MKFTAGVMLAVLAAGATTPGYAQNLEIFPTAPGTTAGCCVGGTFSDRTLAQTFVVPQADFNVLNTFSLWTSSASSGDAVFRASIYAWDGGLSGPALFESSDRAAMSGTPDGTFWRHDFFAGAIALNPASMYAMVMSAVSGGPAHFVHLVNNPYADGSMRWQTDDGPWADSSWDFQAAATFSPGVVTPEPLSLLLLGTGLAGLGVARRRRSEVA